MFFLQTRTTMSQIIFSPSRRIYFIVFLESQSVYHFRLCPASELCGNKMLRCPPSRVDLTMTDLHDFERRLDARQTLRVPASHNTNVRLSPGPGHHMKLAIVPGGHNTGRKRAAKCSSEATICSVDDDGAIDLPITLVSDSPGAWAMDTTSNVQSKLPDQTALSNEAARALESVARHHLSPPRSSPREGRDSRPDAEDRAANNDRTSTERSLRFTSATLDGCVDIQPTASPAHQREGASCVPSSRRGLPVLGEIHSDAYPTGPIPRTEPRPFASARARRRNARSHEASLAYDEPELQHLIQARHIERVPSQALLRNIPQPVPELVLPYYGSSEQLTVGTMLDPGAPVFLPRTRFGAATSSTSGDGIPLASLEPQWGSLDSTHSSSNLRLRSTAEQNADPPLRRRGNASSQSSEIVQPNQRRRSRTSDQNTAAQNPAPNLERYPLLRPQPRQAAPRRTSGSHRPVPIPGRRYSRSPSAPYHGPAAARVSQPTRAQTQVNGAVPALVHGPDAISIPHDGSWPVPFTFSISTTDVLQPPLPEPRVQPRTSSLAWSNTATPPTRRVPSITSAASGISAALSSRQSSVDTMRDAAAEFLRMRNSPLDDLTERLSRFSASRPRSVGRSWERPPTNRARISLLTGDPFRQETSPVSPSSPLPGNADVLTSPEPARRPLAEESVLDVAGALSRSPPSSSALPSTPPTRGTAVSSPHQPLDQRSPARARGTPGSAVRRKPVPTTTATPKVKVYNDAEPPNTQPQTPADVARSTRRKRGRSDPAVQQGPSAASHVEIAPSPAILERHPHRNTYPSTIPPQQTAQGVVVTASPLPAAVTAMESARRDYIRRRAEARRSSEQVENELESHAQGLEEDRRLWISRREDGCLDTTPPAEGRFERYLS